MTWDAYHRRKKTLRDVLALADRDRDLTAEALLDAVPEAREAFADDAELLLDVQMAWFQRLSGQLDQLVAESSADPEVVAIEAWTAAAAQMPGARALLDAAAARPELAVAQAKERAYLARTAGVADRDGRRVMEAARERAVYPEVTPLRPRDRSLIGRLRSALAA